MDGQTNNDDAPRVDLHSALSDGLSNVDITPEPAPDSSSQATSAPQATPPVAQPASAPPAQPAAPAQVPPGQQPPPAAAAAATQPPAQAAPTFANVRDFAARGLGMSQAMNFADDQQFTQAVVQSWAGMQQQVRQQAAELQALRAQAANAAAPPAAAPATPTAPDPLDRFKAPEWDPNWERMVDRIEGGGFRAREGHEAVLPKFQAAQQWRQKFANDLMTDPRGTLAPLIQHEARQMASEIVQAQFAERESKQVVDQFLAANKSWLTMQGPNGTETLSPYGQNYTQYVRKAHAEYGVTDPAKQLEIANLMLAKDLYWPLVQAHQANAGGAAANAAVTAANRNPAAASPPAPTGSVVGTQSPGTQAPSVQNDQLSVNDRLRAAMAHLPEQLEVA